MLRNRMECINNSLHVARKYARIIACGQFLLRGANSQVTRALLTENCELGGTDNVQGQIFEHILATRGGYFFIILQIFLNKGAQVWRPFLKTI